MKFRHVLALALLSVTGSALANLPAVHINDFGCGMFEGNGGYVYTDSTSVVITASGNANMKCQRKDPVPNNTGKAVIYNFENTGMLCGTEAGATTKWHETVSASGQATLICQVKP